MDPPVLGNTISESNMPIKATLISLVYLLLFSLSASARIDATSGNDRVTLISTSDESVTLSFTLDDIEQTTFEGDEQTEILHSIQGEGMTYDKNRPILPSVSRFIVVPPDAGIELIVRHGEVRRVSAEHPPQLCRDEDLHTPDGTDQMTYISEGVYPPQIATMSEPLVIRGVRIIKVTTYPIRYDPINEVYLHYENIETELRFTDDEPVNPVYNPNRRNRSHQFLKFIEALAINSENIRRDDPNDEIPPYVGHYLIVTHENCLQYAAPFIEWRRKSGYKVDILSLNGEDADNPATVKNAIQDRYDAYLDENIDPFDYILLIGDRSNYQFGTRSQWILNAPGGESLWGGTPQADYKYACLEGDDNIPDVGISRWPNGNPDLMELVVGKTLAYETDPPMDDPEWFNKTGVYSQHWGNSPTTSWHPSIHTTARWGVEVLESLGFEDVDVYEEFDYDHMGDGIGPWIRDHYNDGTNILIGRAQNYFWRQNFDGVEDNTVFAVDLNIGHFPWTSENSFRTGSADHLKGPVAVTYCYSEPSPMTPMNLVWLNLVKGVLIDDLTVGWGRTYAVTAFELTFPDIQYRNIAVYNQVKTDYGCFSDPGLQPWIGIPTAVNADFPEQLSPEARALNVHVTNREDDEDLPGAQVTVYHPRDMPDPDSEDYADYDDIYMITTTSDEEGMARFVFPDDEDLESGTMYVTVSGRDICPEFGEIRVGEANLALDIFSYSLTQVAGNDDDDINPGETFDLTINAVNLGSEDVAEGVTAIVTVQSDWIEIDGDAQISFGNIDPDGEAEGDHGIRLIVSPSCPDAASRPVTKPRIDIIFNANDASWFSAIMIDPVAPNLVVREIIGGNIIGLDQTEIDIEVENVGAIDIADFSAELVILENGVSIIRDGGDYPAIRAGENSRLSSDPFLVTGSALAIPGTRVEMALILSNEEGFVDTAYFELQVREQEENVPTGPDDYGYSCFDDSDEDWMLAPEYDWIEICPAEDDADFEGTLLEFEGGSEFDIGEAMVIDLGYTLVFYGQEYDQITVATNGYICVGEQEQIVNFENWPLDRCIGGGMGMIAPFWDDLRLNDGGVYYFHDERNGRFIVEWYNLRHAAGGDDMAFQVVLYDSDVFPTASGDDKILFQYQSIENIENLRNGDDEWLEGIPYASVGISSPDGKTGINYTWNNEYPVSASELEPRRALLFTTSRFESWDGFLRGTVIDASNDRPLADVTVMSRFNQTTVTDADGYWEIPDAITGFEFDLRFTLDGYNDSLVSGLFLEEGDSLTLDVALLHPEFVPSQWSFERQLEPDQTVEIDFTVENRGNGPLDWQYRKRLPGNADVDSWALRESYFVGDSTGDSRMRGVVWANNRFYCTGGGRSRIDDNFVYVIDENGSLIDQFRQFSNSRYGMGDLAWDGGLIWGGEEGTVYGFTPDGELQETFNTNLRNIQAVAWDMDRQILWCADKLSGFIIGYDLEGREQMRLPQSNLMIYGLAYWPDDPIGHSLYIYDYIVLPNELDRTVVHKINPETEDILFVADLGTELDGKPEGAFITNQYDVYSWVYISMANISSHDKVDVWQLDARRDWFKVFDGEDFENEIESGGIDAGESDNFVLLLNSSDLPRVSFEGQLLFRQYEVNSCDTLHVTLDVIRIEEPYRFDLISPADSSNLNGNIEPEILFSWEKLIDPNFEGRVSYQLWIQSGEDSTLAVVTDTTSISVDIESLDFELMPQLQWWVVAELDPDLVWSDNRFVFNYIPVDVESESAIPVEFGLESIYPSPFNSIASIRFGMDRATDARISIFDISGREVAVLHNGIMPAGHRKIVWNAESLPSGLYLVRLESAGRVKTAKIALIR